MRSFTAAAVLACAMGALPTGAAAENPSVIASAHWDCQVSRPFLAGPTPARGRVVARLTVTATSGDDPLTWYGPKGGEADGVHAGDVLWGGPMAMPLGAGYTPTFSCGDAPGATGTIELMSIPAPPATFGGVGPSFGSRGASVVEFAGAGGAHQAEVRLSSGAVRLDGLDDALAPVDLAESAYVELGDVSGPRRLRVAPLPGPSPVWTLTIRKHPVDLAATTRPDTLLRPGQSRRFRFAAAATTLVRAVVLDGAGTTVRVLSESMAANAGNVNGVSWDGRGTGGAPVPDGRYSVSWTTAEPGVAPRATHVPVIVDGTPPTASADDRTLARRQPLVLRVRDAGSRVRRPAVAYRVRLASRVSRIRDGLTVTVRPPRGGWRRGRSQIRVTALDSAGNALSRTIVVVGRGR